MTFTKYPSRVWIAAHTKSRHEKKLAAFCERNQIPHYLPTLRIKTRHRGAKRFTDQVVFKGYVFLAMSEDNRLPLLESNCIANIYETAEQDKLINEINNLHTLLSQQDDTEIKTYLGIKEGAHIQISKGPFRGIEGVIVKIKNKDHLVVNVEMLGQSVAVELDETSIKSLV